MTDLQASPSQRFDPYAHGLALGGKNIWEPFMGPPTRTEQTNPYHKKSAAKYNATEAYIGQNEYLKDTMEDWMFTANQTWFTERILPWYVTENIHVQWTQWESNPHYMGITPHQATSTVVTSKHSIRKASMVRRGIAAEFENDFVNTDLGRSRFMASLAQIARSVQETANVEVLRALIHCHRYSQQYVQKYQVVTTGDLDRWIERKWERFMIAQKDDNGLETMNTVIDQELEQMQAKANVWILGREVFDYCTTVPPGKIWFFLGGQEAVDRLNGKPSGRTAEANTMGNVNSLAPQRMIKDTPVYLAKSFFVDSIGTANLLSRTTEVGVFNTMFDRNRDHSNYTTESRNLRVYSNGSDDWEEIEFVDAIKYCVIWNEKTGDLEALDNAKRNSKAGPTASFGDDYLGYKNADGTVTSARYIGDMGHNALDVNKLLQAGQTVWNAVCKRDKNIQKQMQDKLMKVWNTLRSQEIFFADVTEVVDAGGNVTTPKVDKNAVDTTNSHLRSFAQSILQLLGRDNMLFATEQEVIDTFFNKGLKRIKKTDGNPATNDDQLIESSHRDFLLSTLGAAVPDAHKPTLEEITNRPNATWQERAKAVKELVSKIVRDDPSAISSLPNDAAINRWYKKRETDYTAKVAGLISSGISSSGNPQGSVPAVRYAYISPEAPIPVGWVAVDANQQCVDPHSDCPTHISHFVGIGANASKARGREAHVQIKRGSGATVVELDRNVTSYIEKIANSGAPTLVKWCAIAYLGTRFNRERFISLAQNHIAVPLNFLLVRPHATYKTRYGIKCAANGESGYTFFGHSNMQVEWEAAHKVGLMHYTAYLSAVVFQPRNVYVVEDLFCERYLGGMDTTFWKRSEYTKAGANRRSKSILCLPLPPNQNKMNDWKIDMRGQFYTEQRLGLVDDERFNTPCYMGMDRIQHLMGWHDPIRRNRGHDATSYRFSSIPVNYLCGQAVQFHWNSKGRTWDQPITEKSAFGDRVYPGCGKVRNGHLRYLQRPTYLGNQGLLG